jgi:hypothetical protein
MVPTEQITSGLHKLRAIPSTVGSDTTRAYLHLIAMT